MELLSIELCNTFTDVKVSKERGGGKVARTSSAEKRRHSDSKHSLSSTSSSSDEELKELATPKSTKHKQSLRNSTFSRNFYDEEVFMEPSRSGGLPKRSKMTSIQPSSGRYTDFDKMRRTQGFQQGHITVRTIGGVAICGRGYLWEGLKECIRSWGMCKR